MSNRKKVALLTEVLSYFDTQNDVDISLVEVGDCTQGEMQVIQPQQLGVTQSEIVGLMDNFNEYKGTTAIACAMSEVLDNQFNTADNTNDIMIVISDLLAFDLSSVNAVATDAGNQNVELISVSAAASIPAMANISTEPSNQFQANYTPAEWAAMADALIARICDLSGTRFTRRTQLSTADPWINSFIWKAVVRYHNRFGEYPTWMPCYEEHISGEYWEWNDPKCHV